MSNAHPQSECLLLDASGSMTFRVSPTNPMRRCDVVLHALQFLLASPRFATAGLRTVCASANAVTVDAVLSRETWEAASEAFAWAGSSFLMPGWRRVASAHGKGGARGVAVVLSDGEAHDAAALCDALMKELPEGLHVSLCLLGEGPNFERAYQLFTQLSASQPRVAVVRLPAGMGGPSVALALEAAFSGSAWFPKEQP